jgi:hypothetical protein
MQSLRENNKNKIEKIQFGANIELLYVADKCVKNKERTRRGGGVEKG